MKPVVQIKWLAHGAGLQPPQYATAQAAGMDIRAAVPEGKPVILRPGERALIDSGFAMALPDGFEAQIRPRSGLAIKHGVTCLNAPGTIDADYRGEVKVILVNLGVEPFTINRGERIAQMLVCPVTQCLLEVVDDLNTTQRSSGGFGSTGLG